MLSKARARWGKEVFERLFVRTVGQCVEAGLVDGRKLHLDASLIEADVAKGSVMKGPPELIAALKRAYRATESKLEEATTPESYEAVNDRMMSTTDPDAAMARKAGGESRPRYHHHRAVDDQKGVITAVETTPAAQPNNHHFKRARWRRLWRQQIQDYLIAAIQNVRILLAHGGGKRRAAAKMVLVPFEKTEIRPRGKGFLLRGRRMRWPALDRVAFFAWLSPRARFAFDFSFA